VERCRDPISRLQTVRDEIDRTFGEGYAVGHPDVVCAVMSAASSDWAAMTIARAIEDVAEALLIEEETRLETSSARAAWCGHERNRRSRQRLRALRLEAEARQTAAYTA
jgi:hypothetical protein